MRRILALIVCIFLFALPVSAANAASSVHTTAVVGENGACQVTIDIQIRLDEPTRDLKLPLGSDIRSVTLNGAAASVTQSRGVTSVNLSHLDGKTGTFSCTIHYTINSVVSTDDKGVQSINIPLLYGFPYPVEQMTFTVTMPTEFDTVPTFYSGYHGQDIERQMTASIQGNVISGSLAQNLKDSETLFLKLTAPTGMFPAMRTFGGSLTFDTTAMGICAALSFGCWVLFMGCLPKYAPRRSTVPEGVCAGNLGAHLVHRTADLPLMVLQWAQLGYLIVHQTDTGRVFLHKKMDMGNERSTFEQRCFRDLFGQKLMVDATGQRFQKVCQKASAASRRMANGYRFTLSKERIVRILSCLVGLFAGVAMGDTIATDHTWRVILMALLGSVCGVLCWFIQDGMSCLHLRGKAPLKLSLLASGLLLTLAALCRCAPYGLAAIGWNYFAGLCAAYGGRRTENGARIYTEILGLRRYMRHAGKRDVRRILASNRNYYFELAPYALALGVDKTFAEKFGSDRLPTCTWLVTSIDSRTAREWYPQLRDAYKAMHAERKPALAEKIFGK